MIVTSATAVVTVTNSNNNRHGSEGDVYDNDGFVVAGYLPDYRSAAYDLNAASPFLTDVLLFSIQPTPTYHDDNRSVGIQQHSRTLLNACCVSPDQFRKARDAQLHKQQHQHQQQKLLNNNNNSKKMNESLRIWVTIGGSGRSQAFLTQPMSHLTQALLHLVDDVVETANVSLYGIDFDCEHFTSRDDYDRYMSWIDETTPLLHTKGVQVSVALHVGQTLQPSHLYQVVDRIHLMTYDMRMMTGEGGGAYHADAKQVVAAVKHLHQSGCPLSKIVLGIPAYLRHVTQPSHVKTFAEWFDDHYKIDNNNHRNQSTTTTTTTINLDRLGEASLSKDGRFAGDSPRRVRKKVSWARRYGLAGVFFWELGQDKQNCVECGTPPSPGGILLEAAATGKVYGSSDSDSNSTLREESEEEKVERTGDSRGSDDDNEL